MIQRISLILLIATTNCFAQFYKTYDWSDSPKLHELTTKEAKASSIGILEKHIVEYNNSTFAQELISYETTHKITRVNDDKGINRHNTVYIPMYGVKNVIDIKARTINSKGEIMLLNKDNIKEINNVEEYGDFKIFAIEGGEKNSEIEVLYTVEKEFDMHGNETLQSEYPIREAQFVFITGDLNSRIKAYRTENSFEKTEIDGKSAQQLTLNNLPAMIEEDYATPDANKVAVVYQCFPGDQNISHEMFWNNVVNNVGSKFFPEEPSELVKMDLESIIKENKDLNTFKTATLIDDFIKSNFTIVKNNNAELSDLNYILSNRTSSDFGIIKAYAHYLKAFDIEYEIVVTANRFTYKFDPDFLHPICLGIFDLPSYRGEIYRTGQNRISRWRGAV